MIAPPAHGVNRTDGWRLSGFSLQGLGRDAGGNGLYLIQTSRAVISDIGIAHFTNGLHLNGASCLLLLHRMPIDIISLQEQIKYVIEVPNSVCVAAMTFMLCWTWCGDQQARGMEGQMMGTGMAMGQFLACTMTSMICRSGSVVLAST